MVRSGEVIFQVVDILYPRMLERVEVFLMFLVLGVH